MTATARAFYAWAVYWNLRRRCNGGEGCAYCLVYAGDFGRLAR